MRATGLKRLDFGLNGVTGLRVGLLALQVAAMPALAQQVHATPAMSSTVTHTSGLSPDQMAPRAELRTELPGAQLAGTGMLMVWGFKVYTASLWVPPGFRSGAYLQYPFALSLAYLRDLDGSAIAKRSLEEMQRLGGLASVSAPTWQAWQMAMARIFPDVTAGDRITGIYKPGKGVRFLVNGQAKGEIPDPEFARLFFGIWLSDASAEPALRQALLGQTPP